MVHNQVKGHCYGETRAGDDVDPLEQEDWKACESLCGGSAGPSSLEAEAEMRTFLGK